MLNESKKVVTEIEIVRINETLSQHTFTEQVLKNRELTKRGR